MTLTQPTNRNDTDLESDLLYRDIHKGIRAELFGLVGEAGQIDPHNRSARVALAERVRAAVELLESHAEHEDAIIQPVLEDHLPVLAERIHSDHERFSVRTAGLSSLADEAAVAPHSSQVPVVYRLYLELAEFTGAYLIHQDLEERAVQPALEAELGPTAVSEIHQAIVTSIPPDEMARSLAIMLPAMNIDDRTEMLSGIRMGAPAQVFEGILGLANSVLTADDVTALEARLGIR